VRADNLRDATHRWGAIISALTLSATVYLLAFGQEDRRDEASRASPAPSIADEEAEKVRRDLIREAKQRRETAAQAASPAEENARWEYFEREDNMGRGTEKSAQVVSTNAVSFGFPYAGEQHAALFLRKSPKYGKDAILQIEHGQFSSSFVQNFVTVRFDKGELQKFVVGDSADGSSNVLFIRHYDRFVNQLRKAKTVKIEASFYREGSKVFEFDVRGLRENW
jgi:hypothetical protein